MKSVRNIVAILIVVACAALSYGQTQDELAQKIDQYLIGKKTQTKPLSEKGNVFVARGSEYGVEPRLIVAISGAESSFGAHICSQANAWNWFWNGTCEKSPFDTWDSGIKTVSKFMRKSYLLKGYNTIPLIGKKYCASGCEHWEPNVTQFYRELGGNPALLTYAPMGSPVVVAGTPTPDAQPDPTPVATPKAQAITISAKVVKVVEPEKSWLGRKSAATQVDVEAVIAPNEPLAKSVKLVRVTPQGAKELAVLRQEGRDENNAYVFSGSGSFEPGEQKSVDLQVVAGFAKPKGRTVTSNAMTVTVVPQQSGHGWLIAGIIAGVTIFGGLIAAVVVLLVRSRKLKAAAMRQAA